MAYYLARKTVYYYQRIEADSLEEAATKLDDVVNGDNGENEWFYEDEDGDIELDEDQEGWDD